jgi:hypothetical protein
LGKYQPDAENNGLTMSAGKATRLNEAATPAAAAAGPVIDQSTGLTTPFAMGQAGGFQYDDPHLAWLVSTYLHTPEGAGILADHEPKPHQYVLPESGATNDDWLEPSKTSYEWPEYEPPLSADEETDQPDGPAQESPEPQFNQQRLAILVASLAVFLSTIGLLIVLVFQSQPEAIADTSRPAPLPRAYPVYVECPFMVPTTMAVVAAQPAAAIDATRRALVHCQVGPGNFDVRSDRR